MAAILTMTITAKKVTRVPGRSHSNREAESALFLTLVLALLSWLLPR
jgi:hypothetical protein